MPLLETKPLATDGEQIPWLESDDWGPEKCGAELIVNGPSPSFEGPFAIDVETDERDGFVGIALCQSERLVFYYTHLEPIRELLESAALVGHNLKGDIRWLKKWGVNVSEANLSFDTMIASYVVHCTRESHGLKPLASQILGMSWPTYKDMTTLPGSGKKPKRTTLDKVAVGRVARYCGMDVLATLRLYTFFLRSMTPDQKRVFNQLEMPLNRLLFKMQEKGIEINLSYLSTLETEFAETIKEILAAVDGLTSEDIKKLVVAYETKKLKEKWEGSALKAFRKTPVLNPGSWQQKRLLLNFLGMAVESTGKQVLAKFKGNKLIDLLLQHSQIAKLYNGFICAFKELPTLPSIHTTFNQVSEDSDDEDDMRGLRTGRLSSCEPNLQQIPARTEDGRKLRNLFVPREGHSFIVADYSQIELRVAAHFSHDPILVRAFKSGEDVHEATAKALGVERFYGKTGNFLLAFGGWHKRLMSALDIDERKAKDFYDLYWRKFAVLKLWKDRMVDLARARGGVRTLYGRWIPVADLNHSNQWIRGKAERFAISGIVQGSAADIIKLAMLECDKAGFSPLLAVHDEMVFEVMKDIEEAVAKVKSLMESIVRLDVPIEAVIGYGDSWGSAKAA